MGDLDRRRASYDRVSRVLAAIDDEAMRALVAEPAAKPASQWGSFWGSHQTVDLDGELVFVKRLPVTALELDNELCTRNLYELPSHYSYGAGSVGFGAFRELAAHVKTTGWVLDGVIESFPLMYHHRLLPRTPAAAATAASETRNHAVRWNDSQAIHRYVADRAAATREVVVFLEYFPHDLATWLPDNQHATTEVLDQIDRTVRFLGREGIVHFDAHFGNFITDGSELYLTDFGLLLDPAFELDDGERGFLAGHAHYDRSLSLLGLATCLFGPWQAMKPDDRAALHRYCGVAETEASALSTISAVIDHVEDAADFGLAVEPPLVAAIVRYREVITAMSAFLFGLQANTRKDATYNDAALASLLNSA